MRPSAAQGLQDIRFAPRFAQSQIDPHDWQTRHRFWRVLRHVEGYEYEWRAVCDQSASSVSGQRRAGEEGIRFYYSSVGGRFLTECPL